MPVADKLKISDMSWIMASCIKCSNASCCWKSCKESGKQGWKTIQSINSWLYYFWCSFWRRFDFCVYSAFLLICLTLIVYGIHQVRPYIVSMHETYCKESDETIRCRILLGTRGAMLKITDFWFQVLVARVELCWSFMCKMFGIT